MARLEKPSIEEKIPGMMAQGDFQPRRARIQKHRGQQSGRARRPRFLAEIRMEYVVGHWCIGGKRWLGDGRSEGFWSGEGLGTLRKEKGRAMWSGWP